MAQLSSEELRFAIKNIQENDVLRKRSDYFHNKLNAAISGIVNDNYSEALINSMFFLPVGETGSHFYEELTDSLSIWVDRNDIEGQNKKAQRIQVAYDNLKANYEQNILPYLIHGGDKSQIICTISNYSASELLEICETLTEKSAYTNLQHMYGFFNEYFSQESQDPKFIEQKTKFWGSQKVQQMFLESYAAPGELVVIDQVESILNSGIEFTSDVAVTMIKLFRELEIANSNELASDLQEILGNNFSKEEIDGYYKRFEETFKENKDSNLGDDLLTIKLSSNADISEIQKLANQVFYCCLRDGAEETTDPYMIARITKCALLSNSESNISKACKYINMFFQNTESYDAKNFANALIKSEVALIQSLIQTNYQDFKFYFEPLYQFADHISPINEINNGGLMTLADKFKEKSNDKVNSESVTKADTLRKFTINYAGAIANQQEAAYVGGNSKFGAQLWDHCITKKDHEIFDSFLDLPISALLPKDKPLPSQFSNLDTNRTLNDLDFNKDMSIFMFVVDELIRNQFTNDNFNNTGLKMEQQATREKTDYNQSVFAQMALYSALGTNAKFSQTNISMLFAMNMGDCRHHAQVKQLLFDRWKDRKLNTILTSMMRSNDPVEQQKLEQAYNDCYLVEMRMVDSRISVPIELKKDENGKSKMYRPEWTPDGKMKVAEEYQDLEEHTFCVLITRNQAGELTECRFADAFYRDGTYDLSYNGKNSIINLDGIRVVKRKNSFASVDEKNQESSEEYIWEFTEEAGVKLNTDEVSNERGLSTGVRFRPSPFTRSGKNRIVKMKGMAGDGLYYLGQEKIHEDQVKKFVEGKIVEDVPGKYNSGKSSEESSLAQRRNLFMEIKKAILQGMVTVFPVKTLDKDGNEITLDINSLDNSRLPELDKTLEGFKSEQDRILYTRGDIYDYTFCAIFNLVCEEIEQMPIDQMEADQILDIITKRSQCLATIFAKEQYQSQVQGWFKAPDYTAIMSSEEFQAEYQLELESIAQII